MALTRLCTASIDRGPMDAYAHLPEHGAECSFTGCTRNHARGRDVVWLDYTAHVGLAEAELRRIAVEAEGRWHCRVAITHRLGRVDVGDASVIIVVGAAHRAEAFDACRWCIEEIKRDLPVWKKEVAPDGAWWIEGDTQHPSEPTA